MSFLAHGDAKQFQNFSWYIGSILTFVSSDKSLEKIMSKKQPKKVKGRKASKEPQPKSWVPDELARQSAENFVEKVEMPIGR